MTRPSGEAMESEEQRLSHTMGVTALRLFLDIIWRMALVLYEARS